MPNVGKCGARAARASGRSLRLQRMEVAREFRDVDTFSQAILAEEKLNAWLWAGICEKEMLHYCR